MNNDEMNKELLLIRDKMDEFMQSVPLNYENLEYTVHADLRHDATSMFSNLNLVYCENRINKLHNREPTDRLEKIAIMLFSDIPKFIEYYTEKLKPFKK